MFQLHPLSYLWDNRPMIILGIESTCDETACALVKDGREILANVVFSQTDLHEKYGGVFPELACRRHIDAIIPVIQQAFEEAGLSFEAVDGIAVSYGPGLIGALLIGLNVAKTLSVSWNIPFVESTTSKRTFMPP